ncbi:response regulator [Murimonas intestini]|nr:response regulator [Murimonas intestini]MCR1865809.1 response regulator [Murimonas intestini]MCR1883229.1 response regulator [Murimonas intestini]
MCSKTERGMSYVQGGHYNIIFLDINLPGVGGVEIGEIIRQKMEDEMTHIVYISQQAGYAMELFKVRPLDFLIKSVNREIFKIKTILYC